MDKLFPQMYDRPEPRPIGVSLVYWFAFVVGLPSLMNIFLVQTVASRDYSGTSWIIMLFCVVNFIAMVLTYREYLREAFINVRYDVKKFLLTVILALALLLLAYLAVFVAALVADYGALKEDLLYMLPFAELPMLLIPMSVLETHPLLGAVCMVVIVPVSMCCLYYATAFAPFGGNRPWLGYLAVIVLSGVPRLVGLTSTGWQEHQLILFLLQLPWHLICCWAYQKADTVWAPICVHAAANLIGCMIWPVLLSFLL